ENPPDHGEPGSGDPPRDVAPGESDRRAGLASRTPGGRNPSGVEPRTAGPDCAPPGWGLWDDGDPPLAPESRLSGGGQNQQPWPGAEVAPRHRAMAADVEFRPRDGRHRAPPSLLSGDAPGGDAHAPGTRGVPQIGRASCRESARVSTDGGCE